MTTASNGTEDEDDREFSHQKRGGDTDDNNEPLVKAGHHSTAGVGNMPVPVDGGATEFDPTEDDQDPAPIAPSISLDPEAIHGPTTAAPGEPELTSSGPSDDTGETSDPSKTAATGPVEVPDDPGQDRRGGDSTEVSPTNNEYEPHELSMIFPAMNEIEFAALEKSVEDNGGLLEPITLYEDKILDGWHRYQVCLKLGIGPKFVDWAGPCSPSEYVLARNLARRHLDESRRAMVAARISWAGKGRPSKNAQIQAFSQEQAAARLSVSRATVQLARKVIDRGIPALVDAVDRREIAVSAAARIADEPRAKQARALEEAKVKKATRRSREKPAFSAPPEDNRVESATPASPEDNQDSPEESPNCTKETADLPAIFEVTACEVVRASAPPEVGGRHDRPTIVEATCPEITADNVVISGVMEREIARESTAATIVDRFADACDWIDESVFDVLHEILKEPDSPLVAALEAKVSRAKAALIKFGDGVVKTRAGG